MPPERSPENAQPYRVELLGTEAVRSKQCFNTEVQALPGSTVYLSITSMLQIPTVTQVGHSDRHPQLF